MSRKATDTRQLILKSAIEAFAECGYTGTSIQHILKTTGMSKPTLYYYFKSKAELYHAILNFAYDSSFEMMRSLVESELNLEGKLTAVATAWFTFANENRSLMRLVLASHFAAPNEVPSECIDLNKRKRHFEYLTEQLAPFQKSNKLSSDYTTHDLMHGFLGSVSQRIRSSLLLNDRTLDQTLAKKIVRLYLEGAKVKS